MSDPMAKVESPVSPCPIVQPSAVTPPKPINTPPTIWLTRSSMEAKPSQRNVRVASAMPADPTTIPTTPAMPKVTTRDWSLHSSSNSRVYPTGATKLYDSGRPELVPIYASSKVLGSSARCARCPVTYQPATITAPITSDPPTSALLVRKSRLASANVATAAAIASDSAILPDAAPDIAVRISPRSECAAPNADV